MLRYVVLNPVRAGMTATPESHQWSSHRAVLGEADAPEWLAVDDVLAPFAPDCDVARARYRAFVNAAIDNRDSLWTNLVGQMYLGREEWIDRVREQVQLKPRSDEYPRAQLLLGTPMAYVVAAISDAWGIPEPRVRSDTISRKIAAWVASHEAMLTNREIAAGLRLRSAGHVSRMISAFDRELDHSPQLRAAIDRCVTTLRRNQEQRKL